MRMERGCQQNDSLADAANDSPIQQPDPPHRGATHAVHAEALLVHAFSPTAVLVCQLGRPQAPSRKAGDYFWIDNLAKLHQI